MSGGAVKKTIKKKIVRKKAIEQKIVKPASVKTRKKTISRKTVKKAPQKINLKVKINKPKTAKKTKALKSETVIKKQIKRKQKVKNIIKEKTNIPQGEIITKKTERDKQFLMWAGVSFFMILIIVFWIYNLKSNIGQTNLGWQRSEKATNWSQMADELNEQITQLKNEISTVRTFASSSLVEEKEKKRTSIFQDISTSTSRKSADDSFIENLKHKLEETSTSTLKDKNSYYFILGEDKLGSLLFDLEKIKKGDDLDQVKEYIGEPDSEQELRDQRGAFVSKILSYYIKIYQKDKASEVYDRYINFEFDKNNLLSKIDKVLDE